MDEYLYAAELADRAYDEGFLSVFNDVGLGVKVRMKMSKELWNTDISVLLITAGAFMALSASGLDTIGKVADKIMSPEGLEGCAELDKQKTREIKTAVLETGYAALTEKEKAAFWLQIVRNRRM